MEQRHRQRPKRRGCPGLGIGFLWIMPYMTGSIAAFYEDVKSQYNFQHPVVA